MSFQALGTLRYRETESTLIDVSIVIVSYNTRELLVDCLHSLHSTLDGLAAQIIVVDNASADGSAAAARTALPGAQVLQMSTNLGFAAACNIGAQAATGEHILLLNPDTVVRAGCVQALLDCLARHPEAGVIGGRLLHEDGTTDRHSCWGLPSLWSLTCFATGLSTVFADTRLFDPESLGRWPRDTEREVPAVSGCLLLCSRELWNRLGGLDAAYFVYSEDTDFAARVRRLGYRPRITPEAQVVHIGGASSTTSASKWTMLLRGKVTYLHRNWSPTRSRIGTALLFGGAALRAVAARLHAPVAGPWIENWRDRAAWRGGWEDATDLPVAGTVLP